MKSTIKIFILALCFSVMSGIAWGQPISDFRTHQSGDWHAAATWERFNGLFWEWPSQAPSSADGLIRILAGHTVTAGSANATADQLTVEGTLNINSGRVLTIADGPGIDLLSNGAVGIRGTLINNGSIRIDGGTLAIGTLVNNGDVEIGGIFEFNQGTITGNDLRYGPTGSAVINFPGYTVDQDNRLWPSTNGPANVTVQGNVTLNAPRIVSGSLNVFGTLRVADVLTTTGTTQVVGTLHVDGTYTNDGTMEVRGTLQVTGTFTNNGTTQISGTFQINQGGAVIGNGFVYTGCCNKLVFNGSFSVDSETAFWPGTNGPANVTVQGATSVTLNAARTVSDSLEVFGTFQVAGTLTTNGTRVLGTLHVAGTLTTNGTTQIYGTLQVTGTLTNNGTTQIFGTCQVAGTLTNNGTAQIEGTFQLEQGGAANGSDFIYGTNGRLVFNNSSGPYGVNSGGVYWPTASGPAYVILQGAGGITMNDTLAVSGFFQTAAGVTNASNLTFSGTVQINAGGFFDSSPIYSGNSTLVYYTGGAYNVGPEWASGTNVGQGVPMNIAILNNTTVNMPSTPRTCPRNLSIGGFQTGETGTLVMNTTSGADLSIGGTFLNTDGTFIPNSRVVVFNGDAEQSIIAQTTFDYLTINNSAGIRLPVLPEFGCVNITVNQTLTFLAGNFTLEGCSLILQGAVIGASASRHIVTPPDGGWVSRSMMANESFQFPVGPTATSYNPLTIALDPADPTERFSVRVDSTVNVGAPDDSLFVQRTWSSSEDFSGDNHAALTFQWAGAEEGENFTRNVSSTYVLNYEKYEYVEIVSNGDASGTDPYIVGTTGGFPCTEFGSLPSSASSPYVIGRSGGLTAAEESKNGIPTSFMLSQNHPNPFNPSTTIRYAIPKAGYTTLKIYNLLGKEIATLVSEKQSAGEHEIRWHPVGLMSGVYVYRLQAGEFVATQKLVLLQ